MLNLVTPPTPTPAFRSLRWLPFISPFHIVKPYSETDCNHRFSDIKKKKKAVSFNSSWDDFIRQLKPECE